MSPIWGHIVGVITVILMLLFIGIWFWAWRKHHKPTFSQLASLPMEDDLDGTSNASNDDGSKQA